MAARLKAPFKTAVVTDLSEHHKSDYADGSARGAFI